MNCSLETAAASASPSPPMKALNLVLTLLFHSRRALGPRALGARAREPRPSSAAHLAPRDRGSATLENGKSASSGLLSGARGAVGGTLSSWSSLRPSSAGIGRPSHVTRHRSRAPCRGSGRVGESCRSGGPSFGITAMCSRRWTFFTVPTATFRVVTVWFLIHPSYNRANRSPDSIETRSPVWAGRSRSLARSSPPSR